MRARNPDGVQNYKMKKNLTLINMFQKHLYYTFNFCSMPNLFVLVFIVLVAAIAAYYLSEKLGLCGDLCCWWNTECHTRAAPSAHNEKKEKTTTFIYMIHAKGCVHCKNAMPEFKKLQRWIAEEKKIKGLTHFRAMALLPPEIEKNIPEIRSPRKWLSQGVPLYLIITRPSTKKNSIAVYNTGKRTAQSILDFAKVTRAKQLQR